MALPDNQEAASLEELDLQYPPLPRTLLKAVELTHQPNGPELEQVVELVQHDPAVVARLLRVVNSAYYGQRGEITSVPRALLILGSGAAVAMVMSMSLTDVRSALAAPIARPFFGLVRHCVATAFLAQHLLVRDPANFSNELAGQRHVSEAFTGGILHDVGKLILLYNFPEKAAAFYAASGASTAPRLQEEQEAFGHDHVEIGLYLAERLKFPESLIRAIAFHHRHDEPLQQDKEGQAVIYTIAAANKAANSLGYAFDEKMSWEACQRDPIWEQMIGEKVVGYATPAAILEEMAGARQALADYVEAVV